MTRTIGAITLAAVVWATAPSTADAALCSVDISVDASATGGQSVAADGSCGVVGGPSIAAGLEFEQGDATVRAGGRDAADVDGDGQPDTQGSGDVSLGCGPPAEWGTVTGVICPILMPLI